jgi:hypothetical protein
MNFRNRAENTLMPSGMVEDVEVLRLRESFAARNSRSPQDDKTFSSWRAVHFSVITTMGLPIYLGREKWAI